jgi:hypothetical protein
VWGVDSRQGSLDHQLISFALSPGKIISRFGLFIRHLVTITGQFLKAVPANSGLLKKKHTP